MKNLFRSLLCIIFASSNFLSTAQNQKEFPIKNATWVDEYYTVEWNMGWPNYVLAFTENYCIDLADTIINSTIYSKVEQCNIGYHGAIRKAANVVYFVPKDSISESLLYDFNLITGDTIHNVYNEGPFSFSGTLVVSNIDSVLIGSIYHKRINFNEGPGRWIEGIGNDRGFLKEVHTNISDYQWLTGCMDARDTTWFPNYDPNNTCNLVYSGQLEHVYDQVSVHPNPTQNKFHIELKSLTDSEELDLKIHSYDGSLILSQLSSTQKNNIIIDSSDWPVGIYFGVIKSRNTAYTFKVVKN